MAEIGLKVEAREGTGKGPARRLRASGGIPGIFYGPKSATVSLTVAAKEFERTIAHVEGSRLIRFSSAAQALEQRVALLREVQRHPLSGDVLHLDFYEVDLTRRMVVQVPLHFVGKSKGVTEGGILQPVLREVEVECLPSEIPQFIEVDVTELDIHDALHLADLKMPSNVTAVFEHNEAVVTVLAPTVEETKVPEEGAEEAPVEGAAPAGEGEPAEKGKEKEKESEG